MGYQLPLVYPSMVFVLQKQSENNVFFSFSRGFINLFVNDRDVLEKLHLDEENNFIFLLTFFPLFFFAKSTLFVDKKESRKKVQIRINMVFRKISKKKLKI